MDSPEVFIPKSPCHPAWTPRASRAVVSTLLCLALSACEYSPAATGGGGGGPTPPAASPTPSPGASATPRPAPSASPAPAPSTSPSSAPSGAPTAAPSPSGTPIALVYGGPGVLTGPDDTLERAEYVAALAGFKVVVVTGPLSKATLDSASIWIQPGGPNLNADRFMNGNGLTEQVRDFVSRGGGYVGFCGGAFSALNNLALIPGSAWNLDLATGKTPINWLGKTRYIHFEDGPYLTLTDPKTEVVGTYSTGEVAAARGRYGKGEVFISGVHPEANSDWPPTWDPDGPDTDLAVAMIREAAALPTP